MPEPDVQPIDPKLYDKHFTGIYTIPRIDGIKKERSFIISEPSGDPIVPTFDPETNITRIVDYINALAKAKAKDSNGLAYQEASAETTAATRTLDMLRTKTTKEDVERMIDIWTDQTFSWTYPNRPIPNKKSNEHKRVKNYLLKIAFNNTELNKEVPDIFSPTDVRKRYGMEDRLLNVAKSLANINMDETGYYVEKNVGVYITPELQVGKFIDELSLRTGQNYGDLYKNDYGVRINVNNSWATIQKEIKDNEGNRSTTGGNFATGVMKLAIEAIENKNNSGWILTQFTDQPQTKMQFELNQDIAAYGEKAFENFRTNPGEELSKRLPSNSILREQYGEWAVKAKTQFVDQFKDRINKMEIANIELIEQGEGGVLSENIVSQQNLQLIKNLVPQWEGALKSAEQKNNRVLESEERDALISQFDNFNKSKTQVNSWFNSEGITVDDSFKNTIASYLVGINPDIDSISAHDVVNSVMLEVNPDVLRKQADMSIINKLTPNTANYTEATQARQRQGYAYSPLGELKQFTAQRFVVNPETGNKEALQESGDELMRNLHLYPELVQRTILYGINRPQTEITSYNRIGATGLPSGLFEGIEGQSPYFEAPPAPGGTFTFSPNYIEKPQETGLFDFQQIASNQVNTEQTQTNVQSGQINMPNLTPSSMGEG